jgi:hypothetical protein
MVHRANANEQHESLAESVLHIVVSYVASLADFMRDLFT